MHEIVHTLVEVVLVLATTSLVAVAGTAAELGSELVHDDD